MREAFKFIKRNLGTSSLVGVEIGVRKGDNVLSIINSSFIRKLYLVDHYQPHIESSGNQISLEQQENFYSEMFHNLYPYVDKLIFVSVSSKLASTLFTDNFFDFVYIDAGHSYEDVQNDLRLWLPKVRNGGIICGHDYNNKCTPDVARAIKDFFKIPVYALGDLDWAVIKEY